MTDGDSNHEGPISVAMDAEGRMTPAELVIPFGQPGDEPLLGDPAGL